MDPGRKKTTPSLEYSREVILTRPLPLYHPHLHFHGVRRHFQCVSAPGLGDSGRELHHSWWASEIAPTGSDSHRWGGSSRQAAADSCDTSVYKGIFRKGSHFTDENSEALVSGQDAVGPGCHPAWLCAPKLKIMGYSWDRQVLPWGRR